MATLTRTQEFRNERCWTQEQLAERAGVSLRTIQRMEQSRPARVDILQAVATALGVKPNELRSVGPDESVQAKSTERATELLRRLTSGSELLAIVTGAHLFGFSQDEIRSPEEVGVLGEFFEILRDYGDVDDEIGPKQQLQMAFDLNAMLEDLDNLGIWVFGGRVVRKVGVGVSEDRQVVPLLTAAFEAVHNDNPHIIRRLGSVSFITAADSG